MKRTKLPHDDFQKWMKERKTFTRQEFREDQLKKFDMGKGWEIASCNRILARYEGNHLIARSPASPGLFQWIDRTKKPPVAEIIAWMDKNRLFSRRDLVVWLGFHFGYEEHVYGKKFVGNMVDRVMRNLMEKGQLKRLKIGHYHYSPAHDEITDPKTTTKPEKSYSPIEIGEAVVALVGELKEKNRALEKDLAEHKELLEDFDATLAENKDLKEQLAVFHQKYAEKRIELGNHLSAAPMA